MKKQNPLLRLWQLGQAEQGGLIAAIVLAFLGVLGGMLPYFSVANIIIELIHGGSDIQFYIQWCAIALAGYLARSVLYALALSKSHSATFAIMKSIRERLIDKLPKMPLGTILDASSGKLKQIIVDQVEGMERPLAHLLPEMTSNLLVPILILIYLLVLDWRMALVSLVSIPVGMLFMSRVMQDYPAQYAGSVEVEQNMNSTVVEYIGGIEVIKAYNQGRNSYAKFESSVMANAAYFYNWMKSCQLPMSIAKTISPTTLITILPVGWLLYRNGSLSMETFVITIILSLGIAGPLLAAMNFVDSLARVGTTVDTIDSILEGTEQIHAAEEVRFDSMDIRLEDVGFGYHHDKQVLHHVSLNIPAGSMTALVGPSGGGKSTIAKLIAGFWDVDSGSISLGGYDLRAIPLEQLYDQMAFVSRDNYLFDETVRENIRMGRTNATDQEVEDAAQAAGCDAFIRGLENGYDTVVGGGGAHLSGGERQRIAIARAMLKDAPIVILDEATAYMDPENEAVIQKAVAKLVAGKTLIVIAHRLSTVTDADQLVVVKEGQVEATGSHAELLESCRLYKDMWQAHIGVKDGDVA